MYPRAIWMLLACLFTGPCLATHTITHESVDGYAPSLAELRLIFSRQKLYWPDGQAITVFILSPDSKLHQEFCIEQLDILPYVLQRRWDRLVYSGTGDRPRIVADERAMRRAVQMTPGSIGYLSSTAQTQGGVGDEQ
ncbi:hypothetical protein NFHSH190041_32190 [Shewanella sp. NFH-SH190041]|nr:hypothetical protein NFHSH190041_32190 [Shewanella sp. NFH-SH190041]